jgi:hypothetical protein
MKISFNLLNLLFLFVCTYQRIYVLNKAYLYICVCARINTDWKIAKDLDERLPHINKSKIEIEILIIKIIIIKV